MGENILSVQNLHTSFTTGKGDVHAVNGVSFNLEAGKILGIVTEVLQKEAFFTKGKILQSLQKRKCVISVENVVRLFSRTQ